MMEKWGGAWVRLGEIPVLSASPTLSGEREKRNRKIRKGGLRAFK